MPTSIRWPRPLRFSEQSLAHISHLPHECYMLRPFHPPLLDYPNNIRRRVQIMNLHTILSTSLHVSCVQIAPSNPSFFRNILCFYLNMRPVVLDGVVVSVLAIGPNIRGFKMRPFGGATPLCSHESDVEVWAGQLDDCSHCTWTRHKVKHTVLIIILAIPTTFYTLSQ
jgi:hypothetical protein